MGLKTLNIQGRLLYLESPKVMAILNVTDDSFYSGSRLVEEQQVLDLAAFHIENGASILDIGGYSSRPGAKDISLNEELDRVIPIVELLNKTFATSILSVDTFRAEVADQALRAGAHMINDISSGDDDYNMMAVIAKHQVPYILMHKQGKPQNMHLNPQYKNVSQEVLQYLVRKTNECRKLGIKDIVWDVGIGFGKTIQHNYELLNELAIFTQFDEPVLIGLSRKSLIWKTLHLTPEEALNGTTALHMHALVKGVKILRVHDVKEAVECIILFENLTRA